MKTVSISWHAPCRTVALFLPVFPLELRRHQQMTPKYRGISEGLDVRAQVPWCSQRAQTQSRAHSRGIQKCGDNRLAPGQCLPGNIRLTSTRTYRVSASTHEKAAKSRVALSPYGSSNANTKVRLKTLISDREPSSSCSKCNNHLMPTSSVLESDSSDPRVNVDSYIAHDQLRYVSESIFEPPSKPSCIPPALLSPVYVFLLGGHLLLTPNGPNPSAHNSNLK